MKIVKYLVLLLIPLSLQGAVEYDLRKGVDLTATNYRTASLYNQLVDSGTIGSTNKGGIIRQSTTPDTGNNPRYTNFIFISNGVGTVTSPTLMLWNGSGFVPGIVGVNTIGGSNLQDSAVTAGKIAGSAVFGTNIAGNTITGTNIADTAISGDKIANSGIWSEKFQVGAIRGIDITNKTITYTNIADGTITSLQLANDAIGSLNLTNGAVTTAKIALTNITRDLMRTDAIGNTQLTNGAVASNSIAALALNPIHLSTNIPTVLAWGVYTNGAATASLLRGGNATIARIANGRVTMSFGPNFPATTNYIVIATALASADNAICVYTNKGLGAFEIRTMDLAGGISTLNEVSFQVLY